jgi:hypothetical protein
MTETTFNDTMILGQSPGKNPQGENPEKEIYYESSHKLMITQLDTNNIKCFPFPSSQEIYQTLMVVQPSVLAKYSQKMHSENLCTVHTCCTTPELSKTCLGNCARYQP